MKHCTVCKAKYDDSVSFCPVDGEVLEDDPSSIVGTVLDGQYQIDAMLGKGGMGAVYRARHILLGDRVAIKILPPEVRNNAEWLRRFRREGQAARRFRHPNAVTVYDLRTAADGVIYMVMEYVEGHTLDAEIQKRGRLTHSEAFELLEPIMSVLNTAHEMGVVHRDLKPENIMIGKAGTNGEPTIKLLDLGIAKMREIAGAEGGGSTALTIAGQVLGTPYYMSPEQWGEIPRDGSSEIDGRADIYSLGLVFYEMITGSRPFSGTTLQELRREHIQVNPPLLHQVVADVPAAFGESIARAMAKDRGDRQSSAGELAKQLQQSLNALPQQNVQGSEMRGPVLAQTVAVPGARATRPDADTPTILTVDSVATQPKGPAPQPVVEKPLPKAAEFELPLPQAGGAPSATVVEKAELASSVTIPHPYQEQRKAPSRGGRAIFLIAGVLIVGLLGIGVAGFVAIKWFNGKPSAAEATSGSTTANGHATAMAEVSRYWLELEPASGQDSVKVSGMEPISSGQSLKFHFSFALDGYAYIIGPGQQNRPTAFLTAKPPAQAGLENNHVNSGTELSFPSGPRNWLTLDKNPGTETYSIIFSPTMQVVPAFLNGEFSGNPLSQAEQRELADFVQKYKDSQLVTEQGGGDKEAQFVAVKAPAGASTKPLVFEIRIQHK